MVDSNIMRLLYEYLPLLILILLEINSLRVAFLSEMVCHIHVLSVKNRCTKFGDGNLSGSVVLITHFIDPAHRTSSHDVNFLSL
jgi:hypothetical protein